MKGTILTSSILRAEDGNRYSFDYNDFENLDTSTEIVGAEVDFEPENDKAKSIIIVSKLNQNSLAEIQTTQEPQVTKNIQESICEKIDRSFMGSNYFDGYYGHVTVTSEHVQETDRQIKTTTKKAFLSDNEFKGTTTVTSEYSSIREFKIGNEYFNFVQNANNKGLIGDGDEVFVVCNKTNSGHHQAWSVVNFTRDTILYSKHWNFSYSTIGAIVIIIICLTVFYNALLSFFDGPGWMWSTGFMTVSGLFIFGTILNYIENKKQALDYKKVEEFAKNYKK